MAHVSLVGNLRQFTGGVSELDVEAGDVRQLFARLKEIAAKLHTTGGTIVGRASVDPPGAGGAFATHLVDVEVDPDTGAMTNASFLDYRMPTSLDLPMIDAVIVEVPNPRHPYGVRGVGETPIVPPMAAIANAVADATGVRFTELPMSPPRVLKALDEARARGTAKL